MKYCPRNNTSIEDTCYSASYVYELLRKQKEINQKEKELLKKDKILQGKIAKYKKVKNDKAKADLRAAAKLKNARYKLCLALDARNNNKESKSKKKQKKDTKFKESAHWSALDYFSDLINKPCEFPRQRQCTMKRFAVPSSCLQRLFCRPCSCKHTTKRNNKMSCRCEEEPRSRKQNYWERAAGDCYLMTMRRPPQPWIYHRWPQFYPQYLDAKQQCRNCGHVLLFLAGILIWAPCFLCLELCKCCFCACCSEC